MVQATAVHLRSDVRSVFNFPPLHFTSAFFPEMTMLGVPGLLGVYTTELVKRDFKTSSTVKCPDFSMCKISPDDPNGRNRSN
jgi:hypothetical protein